jgi:hypothetical protein
MNTKIQYVDNPRAKHTYRIDLKSTTIHTVEVQANSMSEAKSLAKEAFESRERNNYDWYTVGHCTKKNANG